jgi:predicted O-linked N-acetylglucosamine transferase (SPINDLY family)
VTIPELLADAVRHHQAGRLAEAESAYDRILGIDPRHADSLHFLGVVACQRGHFDRAIELIGQAIAIDSKVASYHSNLGNAFKGRGDLPGAVASYRNALALDRDFLEATYNLGLSLALQGKIEESAEFFRRTTALAPRFVEGHFNLGTTLIAMARNTEAIAPFEKVLELDPDLAEAHYNLANVHMALGEHDVAVSCYQSAIRLNPRYPEALSNLGNALMATGKFGDAIRCYGLASELRPRDPMILSNLGNALMASGALADAEKCYRAALEVAPDHADARNNLGNALKDQGRILEAIACFQHVLAKKPHYPEVHHNIAKAYKDLGCIDQAIEHYRRAILAKPGFIDSHHNLLMAMHYSSKCSETEMREVAVGLSSKFERPAPGGVTFDRLPERRPLRVGYVSGDLRSHPVGYFLRRVFANHDKTAFEIACYSNTPLQDATTGRLKADVSRWRDISGVSDAEAAALIEADGIDILVDLSGHTARNRLPLFARRPAPVQATWLGYFGTTGLPEMDYILADRFVVPAGAEGHFSERVLRLPGSYLCFSPPDEAMPVAGRSGEEGAPLVLGCFNNLSKISDSVIALWADLLADMPDCRLFLKTNYLGDPGVRASIERRFASRAIGSERLILEGPSTRLELLQAYNRLDIALDPFPYGGGTTTAEALWMGVPVVTLRGDRWVGRVSESILEAVGLPDLVARDPSHYREIVRELANDRAHLRSLRTRLRSMVERSPFCDGPRFASALEGLYRQMWRERTAGCA